MIIGEEDRCPHCLKLVKKEHDIFVFRSSPVEHMGPDPHPKEWRPDPDRHSGTLLEQMVNTCSGLNAGPGRVAYELYGKPTVYVFDPVFASARDYFEPCYGIPEGDIWYWICHPKGPEDPATEDWMESISQ